MNKSIVKKLIQAKLLECDALKEILSERMPESMKEKAKQAEADMMDIAKEIIWERMMGSSNDQAEYDEDDTSNVYSEKYERDESSREDVVTNTVNMGRGDAGNIGQAAHTANRGEEKENTAKRREKSKTHHINISFGEEEK